MTRLAALKKTRVGRAVRTQLKRAKKQLIDSFLHYDPAALQGRLRRAGINESDTLLVHANFAADSGFRGAPTDLVNALVELVGARGNLLMVSIPFRGSAYEYLSLNKPFNVRKTMSMMGLATETFRRREGTLRSLHPTHPVLAVGKDAAWLVAGHEQCLFPCGSGSPFEKLRQLNGKILFFDVSFGAITFFHYVEDVLQDRLPFPVYHERLFTARAIDALGEAHLVRTHAFNPAVSRRAGLLEQQMVKDGHVRRGRIGNSHFILVSAEDVVSSFTRMVDSGRYPYHVDGDERVQHQA